MKDRVILYLGVLVVILCGVILYQSQVIRAQQQTIRALVQTYCGMRPIVNI